MIFADNTPPQIASLKIEDAAQNAATNPDVKAYDGVHYTNSSDVTLTLKLAQESDTDGSGVNKITLTNNALFSTSTETPTEIFVDGTKLTGGYTIAPAGSYVTFDKVFTGEEELKFTNVHIVSGTEGAQKVKADVTDFVGIQTEESTETAALILDTVNPSVSKAEWVATQTGVTLGAANPIYCFTTLSMRVASAINSS